MASGTRSEAEDILGMTLIQIGAVALMVPIYYILSYKGSQDQERINKHVIVVASLAALAFVIIALYMKLKNEFIPLHGIQIKVYWLGMLAALNAFLIIPIELTKCLWLKHDYFQPDPENSTQ